MPAPTFPVHVLKTDVDDWVDLYIFDNMFYEDLIDWCSGTNRFAGSRLLIGLSAVPVGASISFWQAMAEAAWSEALLDQGDALDTEHRVELAAADVAFHDAVLRRLQSSPSGPDWLRSSAPGWVRALRHERRVGDQLHRELVRFGSQDWLLRSAVALLLFVECERSLVKSMTETERVSAFRAFVEACEEEAGGVGPFECVMVLLRMFAPLDKQQGRGIGVPRDVLKLKAQSADAQTAVRESLNAARDLAMLRHLHDARHGCGPYTGEPERMAAVVTSDKHLAAYNRYAPVVAQVAGGRIGYDLSITLDALRMDEATRRELTAVFDGLRPRAEARAEPREGVASVGSIQGLQQRLWSVAERVSG